MIISASRRTDIPAFYPEWFMDRIAEGRFKCANPFNPSQVRIVSLLPQDVGTIVFWSKNPEPMFKYIDELDARGYRYYLYISEACFKAREQESCVEVRPDHFKQYDAGGIPPRKVCQS